MQVRHSAIVPPLSQLSSALLALTPSLIVQSMNPLRVQKASFAFPMR